MVKIMRALTTFGFLMFFVLPVFGSDSLQLESSLLAQLKFAREHTLSVVDLWPRYDKAPQGFLLTLPGKEILICHGSAVKGFTDYSKTSAIDCDIQSRAGNIFPQNLLAAAPIIEEKSTIVMGTPESTGKSQVEWLITIFHEHFHQYQSVFENYYDRLNALGLSDGDKTGMWMLNYPFPYSDKRFVSRFRNASKALYKALTCEVDVFPQYVKTYLKQRQALKDVLTDNDLKYLEMQLWAEGVARWTEIEMAERVPDKRIAQAARSMRKAELAHLKTIDPATEERTIVYPFGAAEAMLLERCSSDWRKEYATYMSLGPLIDSISVAQCK